MLAPVTFHGWPAEALEFYEGLEADNSKTYWTAHKAVYDEIVLAPMTELLTELKAEFGAGRIFRPYRDVRFSPDKSPYKTAISATLENGGYVSLSAQGLSVGSGMHVMAPDQIERYRHAVAEDLTGRELERVIAGVTRRGIGVIGRESLKTAPKGYPKDHPRIELLRHKGLIAWQEWPASAWLGTSEAKDRVVDVLRAARPLAAWLDTHVGETRLARERR